MAPTHDAFFKAIFRDVRTTAVHVRNTLPPAVVDQLDLEAMVRRPGSFVDENLRERHVDLLFEVPFRDGQGRALLYVLFEHQSRSDPIMPLRCLRYMLRIWDDLLKADENRRTLPPVVPLVLHHSATGWRAPVAFRELLEGPDEVLEALASVLPQFRFFLTDLSGMRDEDLRGAALYQVACLFLKHASEGDLATRLPEWLTLLAEVASDTTAGLQSLFVVVEYFLRHAPMAVDDFVTTTRHIHPQMQHIIESTADRLEKAGELRGIEKGRQEGRLEGQAKSVVTALEARGMSLTDELRERIFACRDEAELDRLMKRAIVVGAVTELFADDDEG